MQKLKTFIYTCSFCCCVYGGSVSAAPSCILENALYLKSQSLVSEMEQMLKSEEWIALFTADKDVRQLLLTIKDKNFSKLKTVYKLSPAMKGPAWLALHSDLSSLPSSLQRRINDALYSTLGSRINAQDGPVTLSASSSCTVQQTFVLNTLKDNAIYLLTYENAIPVVVSLIPGQDGAVMASAVAVLNKNFKSSSAEDIENFLSGFNAHECTVGRTE
ncbi:Uncharacterised protein [Anaerobiospirillum thomasii]|uniref:Uncharacterized protein n=2 Tax=Anaerobiospirillum thomasii TaxID=179995 RepID=A0A2X0VEH4_9GAMM|nr:hypothetical protein [Anaerobiospirillum thomasii]SPT70014.1 Uncharacterised protein [Anaerobiospirillum thomasii]SPT71345.1 Uncharacterised protein [Anaerobiospirillum thomasii]